MLLKKKIITLHTRRTQFFITTAIDYKYYGQLIYLSIGSIFISNRLGNRINGLRIAFNKEDGIYKKDYILKNTRQGKERSRDQLNYYLNHLSHGPFKYDKYLNIKYSWMDETSY